MGRKKGVDKLNGRHRRGFTLLELIVAIIIIGILASLALPRFNRFLESSKAVEAINSIGAIRRALERYYIMNNGSYTGCSINNLDTDIPSFLDPSASFWYTASAAGISGKSYVIVAGRKNTGGTLYTGHMVVMGYGCKPTMLTDTAVQYQWLDDDKIYWAASSIYRGVAPK